MTVPARAPTRQADNVWTLRVPYEPSASNRCPRERLRATRATRGRWDVTITATRPHVAGASRAPPRRDAPQIPLGARGPRHAPPARHEGGSGGPPPLQLA